MKTKLSLFLALFALSLSGQVQNTKLADRLLLSVQSGASSLAGPNLITNGTFDTSTTGWTARGSSTLASLSGTLLVTNAGDWGSAQQDVTVVSGQTYTVTGMGKAGTGAAYLSLYPQTAAGGTIIGNLLTTSSTSFVSGTLTFTATTNLVCIVCGINDGTAGHTAYFDNIVIREINASALLLPTGETMTNTSAIPTYGHKGSNSYLQFDGLDDFITLPAFDQTTWTVKFRISGYDGVDACVLGTGTTNNIWLGYGGLIKFRSNDWFSFGSNTGIIGGTHTLIFSSNGTTISYYLDGNTTPIATITPGSTQLIYSKLGQGYSSAGYNTKFNSYQFQSWNYSFSASDVTYYSNPSSHLKVVDQGVGGIVGSDVFSGWNFTSGWTGDGNVVDANSFSSNGEQTGIYKSYSLTAGKQYIINIVGSSTSANIELYGSYGLNLISVFPAGGSFNYTKVFTAVGPGLYIANSTGSVQTDISTMTLYERKGNLLDLTAEGFLPGIWRDYYNNIDVTMATDGTAPRLVRSWEGMSAWRFNGTTSYLSSSALLSGEWTFSAWVCPTVGPERYQYLLYTVNGDIYWDNVGFEVAISSNNATTISTTGDGAPKEVWTHIVITRDAVGYTKIYCSGILNAQGSSGTPGTASVFNIGKILTSNYFQGVIEGFQINKGIWSQEQIALSYAISQ